MLNNYLTSAYTNEINEHLPPSEIRFTRTKEEKLESTQITQLMVIKSLETLTSAKALGPKHIHPNPTALKEGGK